MCWMRQSFVGGSFSGSFVRWNNSARRLLIDLAVELWLYILMTNISTSLQLIEFSRPRLSQSWIFQVSFTWTFFPMAVKLTGGIWTCYCVESQKISDFSFKTRTNLPNRYVSFIFACTVVHPQVHWDVMVNKNQNVRVSSDDNRSFEILWVRIQDM